jgi:hypothetical protein
MRRRGRENRMAPLLACSGLRLKPQEGTFQDGRFTQRICFTGKGASVNPIPQISTTAAPSYMQAEVPTSSLDEQAVLQITEDLKELVKEIRSLNTGSNRGAKEARLKVVVDAVNGKMDQLQQGSPTCLEAPALTRVLDQLHQLCGQMFNEPETTRLGADGFEVLTRSTWVTGVFDAMLKITEANVACVNVPHIATLAHAITYLPCQRDHVENAVTRIEPMLNMAVLVSHSSNPQVVNEQQCVERIEIGRKMTQLQQFACDKDVLRAYFRQGERLVKVAVGVVEMQLVRIFLPKKQVTQALNPQVTQFDTALVRACNELRLPQTTLADIRQAQKQAPNKALVSQAFSVLFRGVVVEDSGPSSSTGSWLKARFG